MTGQRQARGLQRSFGGCGKTRRRARSVHNYSLSARGGADSRSGRNRSGSHMIEKLNRITHPAID
jgi:hypothetical protein